MGKMCYPCSVLNIGGLKACPQHALMISVGQLSWYRKEAFVSRVKSAESRLIDQS
jgi:hypothetical protein